VLLAVDGPIFAYKLLTKELQGPWWPSRIHDVGTLHEVENANTDEHEHCGMGLHVASLPWLVEHDLVRHLVAAVVMHTAADIAAIPLTGGGKYRVRRYRVVSFLDKAKLGV
jgi:hypothetical protein